MTQTHKYGNERYWAFLEELPNMKEIAIWNKDGNYDSIIARVPSKYEAKLIVDALISFMNTSSQDILNKKELLFLDFVKANCPEPYSTMAANAILWNDKAAYNKLRMDFPVIYS